MKTAVGQLRYDAARVALAGVLAGVLAMGSAWGQVPLKLAPQLTLKAGKPKLAVLVVGLDQAAFAQTARLAYFAEQAAVRTDRFDVVKLTEALDPENARARQSRLEEAEETMKAGQKSYDDLDTLKALQQYEKAVKLYEQTDLTKNFPGLVQAWLMKVASMIANGENKAAEAELDRIIPLDPRATLSPNYFTPDSIAYAEKVKKNANANAKQTIEVKTAPVNAQVYIDGRFQGIAPLTVSGLTPAEHYVTVIAPGFSLGQQRARSGMVDFDLRKADGYPRYQAAADKVKLDPEGPQRDQAAQEFGRFLGVDQVLLTVLKKSTAGEKVDATALRVEVKDGHNHAYKVGTLQLDDSLAQSADGFYSGLTAADDPKKGGPVTHFAAGGGGGTKKTIGYALLGAGGALVLGGLYFGISASNQASQFREVPQTDTARSAGFSSTGKTYALLADIFILAGLGAAGAGGYFAFAGGKGGGSGDVEPVPEKKPTKKQQRSDEDDLREAEKRKKADEEHAKAEAEAKEAQEKAAAAAEAARKAEEEAKRLDEEAKARKGNKKLSKKEQAEEQKRLEEEKKRAEEEAKKAEEEAAKKKAEAEAAKKKAEEEARKKAEEDAARKKKEEEKKKAQEEDLRNF